MTDIIDYLNSLDNDITKIDISYKNLTELPDLSRFKNLSILICSNNQLTFLPFLNDNLEYLNCDNNQLTFLPPLNDKLEYLSCDDNNLTSLPTLNNNLKKIWCSHNLLISLPPLNDKLYTLNCKYNKLTSLPPLNDNLKYLYCSNNQLTSLPKINNNLCLLECQDNNLISLPIFNYNYNYNNLWIWILNCNNNPICEIIGNITINDIDKIIKWNNFREFYFLSKLRKKIVSWMWKSREAKIRQLFHPSHLTDFLKNNNVFENDDVSLDMFLDNWN
jgi:Leucine-rich repeat (LRR) protein